MHVSYCLDQINIPHTILKDIESIMLTLSFLKDKNAHSAQLFLHGTYCLDLLYKSTK